MSFSPDRREAIPAMVADALGKARVVRLEFEIVARRPDELGDLLTASGPAER